MTPDPESPLARAAWRFVPRAEKLVWSISETLSAESFREDACERHGWEAHTWERLLWHQGLHLNRHRVEGTLPACVPAGTQVTAYVLTREPEIVRVQAADILLEAPGVIAVNKPAWLPVQGTRASQRISLESQLREILGCKWITPAHRLDRHTSGVNLFALSPEAARRLHQAFQRRQVEKTYHAWVRPAPDSTAWTVRGYLVQVPHSSHAYFELRATADPGGRDSQTDFSRLGVHDEYALVEARPLTGRTHQIRVHLAFGQTPAVGDPLYGDPDNDPGAPARLMLHASRLRLRLPGDREPRTIEAPPPRGFGIPCAPGSPPAQPPAAAGA